MIGSVLGENRWEHILDDREHILLGGKKPSPCPADKIRRESGRRGRLRLEKQGAI